MSESSPGAWTGGGVRTLDSCWKLICCFFVNTTVLKEKIKGLHEIVCKYDIAIVSTGTIIFADFIRLKALVL